MIIEAVWFIVVGALLILMAVMRGVIARLPMTGAMVYLLAGFALGTAGVGLLEPDIEGNLRLLRVLTEAGLVISLFAIGMHLRVPLSSELWRLTLRLAGPAMILTIGLMYCAARIGLGLAAGPALLLAAILAPTDPVLANELRVRRAGDDEPLRFALSSEGGSNDGAAYPFVLIALALCGSASLGSAHSWTFAAAIVWGIASALAIGWGIGSGVVRLIIRLRTRYRQALGLEGFIALGLMALAYGAALLVHGYAFIAVFAAGVALRRQELAATGDTAPGKALESVERGEREEAAKDPELAHAYMAETMMAFALEFERLVEFALMLLIGSVVSAHWQALLHWQVVWPALFLFFVARPLSACLSLAGSCMDRQQRLLSGWLGIRGVGAFYYLLFAFEQAGKEQVQPIAPIVLATIVLSVVLHGTSATTLLHRYFSDRKAA
ncbi:cation:proton antiporter [Caballeronia sp. LZ034LL]|uniref:cation:proton antiporter n=1 Tax=Caballeronia sp. LZ034LL TaxID=3038567 RepID=UPI00285CE116|nr:cation:proton antiporter [Caballeronia sp. LZ034LL]MDR5835934.1 cation:proton antiporter [Caballeronia sp. LZ034LL]